MEFVLISTSGLSNQKTDYRSFKSYGIHKNCPDICFFPSLNKDVLLISPCYHAKTTPLDSYANIGTFFRNRNIPQQLKMIIMMWNIYFILLTIIPSNETLTLSTHGHGVPWFHVRIEKEPKYTHYYKKK